MPHTQRNLHPSELLGFITGGLAHDLNNLLSPILLGVQTLQRNDPDDKTKRILSMIELSSRRAAELIRHILDYSRKLRDGGGRCEIHDIEQGLIDLRARNTELNIDVNFGADLASEAAHIAPELLTLIVDAVIMNAVESADKASKVQVLFQKMSVDNEYKRHHRVARSGDYLCIGIKDSGCGMTEEQMKHACDAFYTTRLDSGHAGLGLFFVHTIVKQADGFLEIESQPNLGTEVKLFIPRSTVAL